jgi:septum site-determining protein MinD
MARSIAIISGKGGVGKTTTAINLAAALNKQKQNVIVVDANLNTPNIGLSLGAPVVPITLNHVLKGKADIEDAIYEHYSGTKVIPSLLSIKEITKFNTKKLPAIASKLKKMSDFVIFDSAAGFGEEAIDTMKAVDELIVVTNPEMPSVTDSLKAVKVAQELKKDVKGVIVTRWKNENYEMPIEAIAAMLEIPVIGVIPEDVSVKEAAAKRDALIHLKPNSNAAEKYTEIALKILNPGQEIVSEQGFFKKFMNFLGM